MRLFISINLPQGLYRYLSQMQSRFSGLKNTKEFHLTIQFLGDEIDEDISKKIIDSLSRIRFQPFDVIMGDIHPFPNAEKPRGVWVECRNSDKLFSLADSIRNQMTSLGLIADKPFKAHITLGRYKFSPSKKPEQIKGEQYEFKVDKIYLMESVLTPDGPKYRVVVEFPAS